MKRWARGWGFSLSVLAVMLFAPAARASGYGVSLSANIGAGDACQTQPFIAAEGFTYSQSLSNVPGSLSFSGVVDGYDNAYPDPTNPALLGCQYSPVFATTDYMGLAEVGLLRASLDADMPATPPGVESDGGYVGTSFTDTITAVSGGTYLVSFSLYLTVGTQPGCQNLTEVQWGSQILNSGGFVIGSAGANSSGCSGPPGITSTFGPVTGLGTPTAVYTLHLSAGDTVGISEGLTIHDGAGYGQSSFVDAADTSFVDIVGVNGATYNSAAGVTYDFTEPEPATWMLLAAGLGLARLSARATARKYRNCRE